MDRSSRNTASRSAETGTKRGDTSPRSRRLTRSDPAATPSEKMDRNRTATDWLACSMPFTSGISSPKRTAPTA